MSLSIFIFSTLVATAAPTSPTPAGSLCNQLSSSSCTNEGFSDGTGMVKSEKQIRQELTAYSFRTDPFLNRQWQNAFAKNPSIKQKALKATGLDKSPTCKTKAAADSNQCQAVLLRALSVMNQKQAFGPLAARRGFEKTGSLENQKLLFATPEFKSISQNYQILAKRDLSNPALKSKIEKEIFPQIRALLIAKLQSLSIDPVSKSKMIAKVNAIQFGGSQCKADESSPQYLITNAYYQPDKNTFVICEGYLFQSNSEFQLATSITHELSHSIDPCYIQQGPAATQVTFSKLDTKGKFIAKLPVLTQTYIDRSYPIPNLLTCLRSISSVQAKMPSTGADYFCNGDQIGESFADWMAGEIVPQYIAANHKTLTPEQYQLGYSNARRPICTPENKSISSGVHPEVEKRIDAIITTQPLVRKQMGCKGPHPKYQYCAAPTQTTHNHPSNSGRSAK